jgi:CubicO group peptidase (beta-lactamase class C family)
MRRALLLWCAAQAAQDWTTLESVVREELRATGTPGAALAVVKGEQVVFARGFGVASVETGAAVTPEMLFRLGSTTKMFTAATLLTLAEEGRLRMDRPIGGYISGLHPRLARVTAHQLLTHTAGLADEAPMYGPQDETALEAGIQVWKDDKFFTEPGKVYSYSNPGYWVAGLLAEKLAGRPFADVVAERILEPLGMKTSTFRPTLAMTYPLAQGHEKGAVVRPAANNASGWPAGSLFSSARDLSLWCANLLNGPRGPGLVRNTVEVPGGDVRYGYGLRVREHRGIRLWEHNGNRRGYGSSIRLAPDHKVAVVVLVNTTGGNLPRTSEKALELLLPLQAPSQPRPRPAPTGAELEQYAGVYAQGHDRIEVGPGKPLPAGAVFLPGEGGRIEYLHRGGRTFRRLP